MKLPPLNALRAFDAVARLSSVKDAAAELFVTPAAVSQQLKVLEEAVGRKLLDRKVREVSLNDTGAVYHQATTRHLRAIAEATERLKPGKDVVNVTTVPSFATLWLVPRLAHFTEANPHIEVRIEASPGVARLGKDGFDLAVREGRGHYEGHESQLLFRADAVPVATPAIAKALQARSAATKLKAWQEVRLLHESFYAALWTDWLTARGMHEVDATRGLHFSHTMLVLAAARQGQGVALAPRFLLEEELRSGALVIVDPLEAVVPYSYHLVWPIDKQHPLSDAARRFRDWILTEARHATPTPPKPRPR